VLSCRVCSMLLPPAKSTGRPRQYCSQACRQARYAGRRRQPSSAARIGRSWTGIGKEIRVIGFFMPANAVITCAHAIGRRRPQVQVLHGNCLDVLRTKADNSVDSVVTDAPYNLESIRSRGFGTPTAKPAGQGRHGEFGRLRRGFMGQTWDTDIAFKVDVWRECLRVLKPGGHMLVFGAPRTHHRVWCAIEDAGFEIRDNILSLFGTRLPKGLDIAKSIQSLRLRNTARFNNSDRQVFDKIADIALPGPMWANCATGKWTGQKASVTDSVAAEWEGWHTALKPAMELICVARKPLSGTIAANVLTYGTGGLNIDACRIPRDGESHGGGMLASGKVAHVGGRGRWPANVLHDGSDEVLRVFARFGNRRSGSEKKSNRGVGKADTDSPVRFFYSAKATKEDRAGSSHPTVKPIALLEWLVRLITPRGGTVLDIFAGSGTTGEAAVNCGCDAILIENEARYVADIKRRLATYIAP
jgi:DNA modification methylase